MVFEDFGRGLTVDNGSFAPLTPRLSVFVCLEPLVGIITPLIPDASVSSLISSFACLGEKPSALLGPLVESELSLPICRPLLTVTQISLVSLGRTDQNHTVHFRENSELGALVVDSPSRHCRHF